MTNIAIVNTKGGVGKTTSAIYMAAHAGYQGHETRIVDTDPQGTATTWLSSLEEQESGAGCELVVANLATLNRLPSTGINFIDTPPGNPAVIDRAIAVADFVLIPTAPSLTELGRVWQTLDTIPTGTPVAVLLTQVNPQAILSSQVRTALEEGGHLVFPLDIPRREKFRQTYGTWPPNDSRMLFGYDVIFDQIMEILK